VTDLVLDSVSKRYFLRRTRVTRAPLRARHQALRRRPEEFWALRDVSFEVARGETLGIIGENGAGKSTILKLLSSVTAPTSGEITIRGRLSALIEVGSGFHPELTGRENVYLSGSILGMRRQEITEKLERIIDFAGVRDFIDMPVKRYSSGMYVRLGFSIAAHLEPDILLLDEVLAVGDAQFQAKCLERINELHRHGRTIVFISHDLAAVERLCSRAILLSHGRIVADGPARDIIDTYQEIGRARDSLEQQAVPGVITSREAEITSVTFYDGHGRPAHVFRTGAPVTVRFNYIAHAPLSDVIFELHVYTIIDGHYGPWCQLSTGSENGEGLSLQPGYGAVEFEIAELGLMPGACYVSARLAQRGQPPGVCIDWRQECLRLRVEAGRDVRGTFYLPHRWRAVRVDASDAGPVAAAAERERLRHSAPS
jgi:ABC-type polysaccharide/polyol phosphate transport system ATPase subunit